MKGYVDSIETMGLVDGPGIRCVVFLGGCKLRCKYCHNPETWLMKEANTTPADLGKLIINNKPYYKNNGGVTFSGGEPLLQQDFIIETAKILKKENINIALDTSGVGNGNYNKLLKYIDIVLLDIKHTDDNLYKDLTGQPINEFKNFIKDLNKSNCEVWIRQVIVPDLTDNDEYLESLLKLLKTIKNIKRIDFLPYHKLGDDKYIKLGINNPYKDKITMDKEKCDKLYNKFMNMYNESL